MAFNIYEHEASKNIKSEIADRIKYYSAGLGGNMIDNDAYSWLTKKTAWANIKAYSTYPIKTKTYEVYQTWPTDAWQVDTDKTVTMPRIPLRPDATTKISLSPTSVIENKKTSIPSLYDNFGKIKDPILKSVEVTYDGPYGASIRVNATFTVYSREQVELYTSKFLLPGTLIEVEYGWSTLDKHQCTTGRQIATVFNYNVNLQQDSSFDLTFHATAAGTYLSGVDMNSSLPYDSKNDVDSASVKIKRSLRHVLTDIQNSKDDIMNAGAWANIPFFLNKYLEDLNGLYVYNLPLYHDSLDPGAIGALNAAATTANYLSMASQFLSHTVSTSNPDGSDKKWKVVNPGYEKYNSNNIQSSVAYLTLEALVDLINVIIAQLFPEDLRYECSDTYTIGNKLDQYILILGPANPLRFAFPGEIFNGDTQCFTVPINDDHNFLQDDKLYYGKILISVDYLMSILDSLATMERPKQTFMNLLNTILNQFNSDMGGLVELNCISHDNCQTIVNGRYSPEGVKTYKVLEIPSYGTTSICRNVSLEATLPDKFAADIAIRIRNDKLIETDIDAFIQQAVDMRTELISISKQFAVDRELSNKDKASGVVTLQSRYNDLVNIYHQISKYSEDGIFHAQNNSKARNALAFDIFAYKTAYAPIKLSIQLDGINGFVFGDMYTTNWLPTQYTTKDFNVYFIVSRITHKIANQDWTTDIEGYYKVRLL